MNTKNRLVVVGTGVGVGWGEMGDIGEGEEN